MCGRGRQVVSVMNPVMSADGLGGMRPWPRRSWAIHAEALPRKNRIASPIVGREGPAWMKRAARLNQFRCPNPL